MAKKPVAKSDELVPVTAYLEKSILAELDQAARETRRSRTQMIARLIDEGLKSREGKELVRTG
ncbi:MAG TPA: ribbon-helix-helix protein, CopG family [Tepidisphaeraceae bacterium]|jgi:hypothetical protein|nr:ribbon-helix-helix protein, CopG family [Tepidisphaeraceae bacterium]